MIAFLGLGLLIPLLILLLALPAYLCMAYNWSRIMKLEDDEDSFFIKYNWMNWVPLIQNFIIGKYLAEKNGCPQWLMWSVSLGWIGAFLSGIPYVGFIFSLAATAVSIAQIVLAAKLYWIYEQDKFKLIIGILSFYCMPFFLYEQIMLDKQNN